MLRYMLDTDICSYIMKRTNPQVLRKMQAVSVSEICTSAIVRSELAFGVATSPNRARDVHALEDLLKNLLVLDYPGEAAIDYGDLRGLLKSSGTPIGGNDMFVAAHARHLGLILVTNNTREFGRVPGLKIENWADPMR